MVEVRCRDCGRLGDEDPDDPAPALCPACYEKRKIEEIETAMAEVVRLRDIAWKHGNRADEAEVEIARLRADYDAAYKNYVLQRDENERLRAALEAGQTLVGEMDARMPEHATEDEEGFIASYRIPVGPWHRILGWARGAW